MSLPVKSCFISERGREEEREERTLLLGVQANSLESKNRGVRVLEFSLCKLRGSSKRGESRRRGDEGALLGRCREKGRGAKSNGEARRKTETKVRGFSFGNWK